MANILRIKRRDSGGATGAPGTLENAELAYNEADETLYYGWGTGGAGGSATLMRPIGGPGAFSTLGTTQTVTGDKTFSGTVDFTGTLDFNSNVLGAVGTPILDGDAANKLYVDNAVEGLDVKESVRLATTANIDLASAPAAIDSVTAAADDRILVKDQTLGAANGIYIYNGSGSAMTRSTDADTSAEVTSGMFTFISEGTINADQGWSLATPDPITLGTTSLTFTQFSSAAAITAGDGLLKTGNVFDVQTASATRIVVNADDIDLATTGVTASTYKSVTVDVYGRITAGTNPTTLAGYGITDAVADTVTISTNNGLTGGGDLSTNRTHGLTGQALAVHNLATNGAITRTGVGTVAARTMTGTAARISVTDGDGVAGNPTFDIDSTYVGQATITTLGTIATGTWAGGVIALDYGGTGADLSAISDGAIFKKSGTALIAATVDVDYLNDASEINGGTF